MHGARGIRPAAAKRRSLRGMIGWVLRHMAGAGLWETYAELGDVARVVMHAMGWTCREIDQAVTVVVISLAAYALDAHHTEAWLYGGGAALLLERTRLVAWWHAFHGSTLSASTSEEGRGSISHVETDTDAVRQAEDVARRAVDRSMKNTRDTDSASVHQPLMGTERGDGQGKE